MTPSREKPRGPASKPSGGSSFLADNHGPTGHKDFLTVTRNYLSLLRRTIIDVRTAGAQGRSLVEDYSRIVDTIVGVVFQRAAEVNGLATDKTDIAIIGMGGYGRAELAPYSDVDILVLCKRKTTVTKQVASAFIRLMWDVGFELGHSVESIIESESTLSRHMDTRTALFESRWICGSRRIAREVERQIKRLRRKDREAFLLRKIRDAVARHRKYDSRYQLIEPNVKLSPGGMRDFQTLVWLGMVMRGKIGLPSLARKGLLLPGESEALSAAYDFLLRVRVELHLASESKQDQLSVAMQKKIAAPLGYRARGGHLAVERFMKDYYHHTRTVFRITEDIIEELHYGKNVGVLLGDRRIPKAGGKLSLRIDRRKIRQTPLYIFARQKQTGLHLQRGVRRRLETILHEELKGRSERTRMRKEFPSLLRSGKNLALVLRSMHETGFLGAIIPEYDELTSLKRYDLYHHYTVDEHSFQVVRNLEELATTRSRRMNPLSRLYSEIADKQTLFLAALLHDIGKIQGKGHARKGAILSRKILKRLGIKPEPIAQVSYLIEIHLLMSHFSQRRDPADIGMLKSFCSQVRTRGNLKYLCLLTYADLNATSPIVWTEWKHNLLWALYLRAYQYLASREKEPDAVYKSRKQSLLRAFRQGREKTRALSHMDKLSGRYLLTMNASQVKRHLDLIDTLDRQRFVIEASRGRRSTEITFCTRDKPFRLSQLCGVLTLNDCNILFANAFTRTDGRVIDVFRVADVSGDAPVGDARLDNIGANLAAVLAGTLDLQAALEKHLLKWRRRSDNTIPVRLRVEFDNDTAADFTIIDIFALDRPGLLFKITRALSEAGLTIHRARISTEANRAIDSFDVQGKRGKKVTGAQALRNIRRRIEKALA